MSRRYKRSEDVPTSVLVQRLRELASAVARHDLSEFTMRVPVELDRDADVVLDEAANRLDGLLQTMDEIAHNPNGDECCALARAAIGADQHDDG